MLLLVGTAMGTVNPTGSAHVPLVGLWGCGYVCVALVWGFWGWGTPVHMTSGELRFAAADEPGGGMFL